MLNHIAVIGLGSGGSAVADMLARAGVGKLTLVDPDKFERSNLSRHVLHQGDLCTYKVDGLKERIHRITRTTMVSQDECRVVAIREGFSAEQMNRPPLVLNGVDWDICPYAGKPRWSYISHGKPDLVACCADSDACCQLVNQYCVDNGVPCVFAGVHGAAETAEVITFVPGKTPCYACYEREGPEPEPSQEKYTNPDYDPTKMPHQEGLWCDVLMAASIQFRAILGVEAGNINPLILASLRPPYGAEIIRQKKGCAVCSNDCSQLEVFDGPKMFDSPEDARRWQKNNPTHRI